ncbi:MAG TPA: trypsin-like peptidase domain-containing protein [Gemmatimonadaceae bacterium]|nr:trypsin-like peptidase domain-containing protein [Gemmatimonadaceae bacterium]
MRKFLSAVALAVGLSACGSDSLPSAQARQISGDRSAEISAQRRTAITSAVERVAPSVVTVQTEVVERVPADFYEQFFGGRSGRRSSAGLGSGFIVRADGVIVTNAHVINGATRISVAMRDGTTYPARLLGKDETNDLAVIKIEARNLPVAPIGTSSDLLVGEWAIAIGSPYGFLLANTEPSVTAGVVSGTGRNLAAESAGQGVYVDMIQTDASINPGNSGGPLVNALGEVIGVNSSIFSPSGGSIGLGFAIPINRAQRVTEDLLAHGVVRRPWVGIKLDMPRPGTPRVAGGGVAISTVVPGSPAARAGIRPGDVLLRSRDRVLRNAYDWEAERLELRVGEEVPLVLRRGGSEVRASVRVTDLPEVNAPKVTVLREIQLVTLTPAIRAERNIRRVSGALIQTVSPRVAEQLGIQPGDVILQINRVPIADAESAARALDYYGGRGAIVMYIERQGQVYTTEFVIQ